MVAVAPTSVASVRRWAIGSTAMTVRQPAMRAPITAEESDGARTEHHERVRGLRRNHIEHRTRTGLHAATQRGASAGSIGSGSTTALRLPAIA